MISPQAGVEQREKLSAPWVTGGTYSHTRATLHIKRKQWTNAAGAVFIGVLFVVIIRGCRHG